MTSRGPRTALLVLVVMLLFGFVATASAECGCLSLRIFTPAEREDLETQYGIAWWKVLGLIPGPADPRDWVERPWGDSLRTVYMPQRFWDPRACVAGPKGRATSP